MDRLCRFCFKKVSAKFTVTAADGTNTTNITYYYAWKIGGAASTETSFNLNAETTAELTLTDADAGKTAVLFIYAKTTLEQQHGIMNQMRFRLKLHRIQN